MWFGAKGIQEMMEEAICVCWSVMMGRTLEMDVEGIYIKKAKVRGIYFWQRESY